jgi:excisionase family DNA binding protein
METLAAERELLTVQETAAILRLKVSTIRAWVCQKRIPYIKLGGRSVRIRRADALAFIDCGRVEAVSHLGGNHARG